MRKVIFDENRIDEIFAGLNQCQLPGAAVGIAIGGKAVYRKGFGLASVELPVALSPSMRLRIASTSKHFTCFAFMLLCEDGRAIVDDPVGKFLPELHPIARGVTMRQLMTNTSGIRDVYDLVAQFEDHYICNGGCAQSLSSSDLLPLYRQIDDSNTPPGATWIYNNGGWLLLSTAIERIADKPLEQVMRERIFEPIGMNDSLLLRRDCDFISNRATQHVIRPGLGVRWWDIAAGAPESNPASAKGISAFERMYWGMDNFVGAGAVVSTVDDMLRWLAHMGEPEIGSTETWALMKHGQALPNGTSTGYGFGLMIDRYRGIDTIHHAGNALGGSAEMLRVPDAELDIVILINRQDVSGTSLIHEILDACLPDLETHRGSLSGTLPSGIFHSPSTGRVVQLTPKGETLFVSVGGTELPAVGTAEGKRWDMEFAWNECKQSVIPIGDRSRPEAIQLVDFGTVDEMSRVEAHVGELDTVSIVGRYRYEALGVDASIVVEGDRARLSTIGRFGSAEFVLHCLSRQIWQAKPAAPSRVAYIGGVLTFRTDGFRFSNLQTRPLLFKRLP